MKGEGLRKLLPWIVSAAALVHVFGFAIDWKAIPEATADANLPLFIAITVADKIVFFLLWGWIQAQVIRRFVEPVSLRRLFAVKGGSELLRTINNSLADAAFLLGVSQLVTAGLAAVVAVAGVPFCAHFFVLLVQATFALPLLPGGVAGNGDVGLTVGLGWVIVAAVLLSAKLGFLRRLLARTPLGPWIDRIELRQLLPFAMYFVVLAVFDVWIQGLASRAFGVDIPWSALAARIPILYLAISLPSLGNFGTREIAWAGLFAEFGSREALIAFALWTNVIFLVMHVLIGALFFGRAVSLIRELRQARAAGEDLPQPLLRDAADS